ncbi:MAG: DNA-3-methyladenine glycosylase [Methanotrichaceae archaeon]
MKLKIKPAPPFDLDLSARIFSEGDARFRRYEAGAFWQVIRLGERLALVTLRSTGSVDAPVLSVELEPNVFSSDEADAAEKIVRKLFNLDFNLLPFYEAVKGDRVMSKLTDRLRGLHSPTTQTIFEALIDSIIEQQISLKVAWSLQRRVIETFGDVLRINGKDYYAFPRPDTLAGATLEQLRNCGLSMRKTEYVRDFARLVVNGLDPESLRDYDDSSIIEELSKIRGVGVWTAELTMVRGMARLDAIPADDLGIRRCISHYYCGDKEITGAEARRIAEGWRGWRGLASFYLLTAERLGIEV